MTKRGSKQPSKARHRRQPSADRGMHEPEAKVPAATGNKLLVPLDEPGVFAVFADRDRHLELDFGEFHEFPLMTNDVRSSLGQFVESAITSANIGLQLAHGAYEARGLVRLAPETLQMLQSGAKTIQQGGWNIGSLSGPGGQIIHSVRWLPAGVPTIAIGAAANAAAGLALLALQWQLNRIERLAETNLKVSTEVLQEIQGSQRNEIIAKVKRLSDAVSEARARGAVTAAVWDGFGGQTMETTLHARARDIEQRVDRQIDELNRKNGAKERLEWMNKHGANFLQDLVILIYAGGGLYRYWALRVAHILYAHPDDRAVAETVQSNATRDHQAMREKLAPRIAELWRYFSLVMECPGGMGATLWGRGKTIQEVRDTAGRMHDALGDLHEKFVGSRLLEPEPPAILGRDLGLRLRWLLNADETVKMCGPNALRSMSDRLGLIPNLPWNMLDHRERFLIVTTQRLFVLRLSNFNKTGSVEEVIPIAQLRYEFEKTFFYWRANVGKVENNQRATLIYALDFPKLQFTQERIQEKIAALRDAREQHVTAEPSSIALSS